MPTSISPILDMYCITAENMQSNSLSIPVQICDDTNKIVKTQKLEQPLIARNVDGTPNKKGKITSFVILNLVINRRTKRTRLLVTRLGRQQIILGFPWLREQNPDINWQTGEFKWQSRTFQVTTRHRLSPMQLAKALVRKQLSYKEPKL